MLTWQVLEEDAGDIMHKSIDILYQFKRLKTNWAGAVSEQNFQMLCGKHWTSTIVNHQQSDLLFQSCVERTRWMLQSLLLFLPMLNITHLVYNINRADWKWCSFVAMGATCCSGSGQSFCGCKHHQFSIFTYTGACRIIDYCNPWWQTRH